MKTLFSVVILLILFQPIVAQDKDSTKVVEETRLIFVRHAEKMDTEDRNPSLNKEGQERALKLSHLLDENCDISAIYSTDYNRTQETAAPISKLLGIPIKSYGLQDPDSLILSITAVHNGEDVLIVGHSNTTPDLVNIAIAEQRFEQIEESDYSNIFIVTLREGEPALVEHLTY